MSHAVGLEDALGLTAYSRPAVYTSTHAPNHDRNLRRISRAIESSLIFGHVRAAGHMASVHEYNCHPYSKGRYLFMHNGEVAMFSSIRRKLLSTLRDENFEHISGTTDSELLFALFLDQLPDAHTLQDPAVIKEAVRTMLRKVVELTPGVASSLNIAVTDGETTVATRYRSFVEKEKGKQPPSLYYCLHRPFRGDKEWNFSKTGAMVNHMKGSMLEVSSMEDNNRMAGDGAPCTPKPQNQQPRQQQQPQAHSDGTLSLSSSCGSGSSSAPRHGMARVVARTPSLPAVACGGGDSSAPRQRADRKVASTPTLPAPAAEPARSALTSSLQQPQQQGDCNAEAQSQSFTEGGRPRASHMTSDTLIFASEPLNLQGDDASGESPKWHLLPANTLAVLVPHRPGRGRCKRRDLVTSIADGKTKSDTPVIRVQFESLDDIHRGCCEDPPAPAVAQSIDDFGSARVAISPRKSPRPMRAPSTASVPVSVHSSKGVSLLAGRFGAVGLHGGTDEIACSAPR